MFLRPQRSLLHASPFMDGADGKPKKLVKGGENFDAQARTLGDWKAVEG